MVVMIAVGAEIVIELPVGMDDLADDPAACKFIKIAVNGGEADAAEMFLEALADLFRAHIGAGARQEIEYCQPFRRYLEPKLLQHLGVIMGHWEVIYLGKEIAKWKPFRFSIVAVFLSLSRGNGERFVRFGMPLPTGDGAREGERRGMGSVYDAREIYCDAMAKQKAPDARLAKAEE